MHIPPGDEFIGEMTLAQFDRCWYFIPRETK